MRKTVTILFADVVMAVFGIPTLHDEAKGMTVGVARAKALAGGQLQPAS